ncbi:antitoxin [Saccharopolyspora sp. ASAGF58]|nr:antitoxin [Saccharopolyspora sp. ASAGF58]QIZ35456.1 antitoxin [Saccharopolyspora sp. ASAGF58]
MGFGEFKDRLQNPGEEHGEKIEQGLDRAADVAKEKFGHEE